MRTDITGSENIWIDIPESNLIIGTIYGHSKIDIQAFSDILNSKLEQLKSNKVFLLGDFKINIEATSTNCMRTACTYIRVDMLFSNEYYFLIYVPTRVTENTAIIINYIITNDHTHQIIGDKSRFNRPLPYFL